MSGSDMFQADYQGRSAAVLVVTIVFLVLATLFVSLRMVSRVALVRRVGVDDYLILLAWAIAFGMSFCICYGCRYGLGRHERDIPPEWQPKLAEVDYIISILYQPALMATKSSILAFFLSLLSVPARANVFMWACIGTVFVVNAGGLALCLVTIFQCRPVGAALQFPVPSSASCTDIVTIYLSSAPLNIITDLAMLFLPMPILTGMRLPRKQKIILVITFGFGIFVAVVDVLRIAYLQSASTTRIEQSHIQTIKHQSLRNSEFENFSWFGSLTYMWSAIEVDVGIMCACVPALKPLASRFMPHLVRDIQEIDIPHASQLRSGDHAPNLLQSQRRASGPISSDNTTGWNLENAQESAPTNDESLDMVDFLTTPDMTELQGVERTQTALTNTSRNTQPEAPTFFDFVNMKRKQCLVHMNARESNFPIAMVTILFFIWGFEYGLINVLNQQFQRASHMTPGQGTGIHSAYFAGYFAGPLLVGRLILKHWGFKACFVTGLVIYACGTLIFWPAAVLTSFPAFLVTNFIVALGLSIIEVAANPFAALCGPARYGEERLNFSQGVQATGSVIAPLIANRVFFSKDLDASLLVNAQWAYLGIALFTVLLAVVFYYVPLPEATDKELEDAAERIDNANKATIGGVDVIWITLALGVFSQFCYVGAQEVNGTVFKSYLGVVAPTRKPSNFMAIAHTAFAVSRFFAAGLGFWIKPRYRLLGFYIGAIIFECLAMNYSGPTGTATIIIAFFMEGPLFSLIFAQTLRGMGRHTKLASVFITAAVSGGAVFSPISSHLGSTHPPRIAYSLVVAVATFAAGAVFAVYLNLHPAARKQVDPIRDATLPSDDSRPSSKSLALRAFEMLPLPKRRSAETETEQVEWSENSGSPP